MKQIVTKMFFGLMFFASSSLYAKTTEILNCTATHEKAIYKSIVVSMNSDLQYGKNMTYKAKVSLGGITDEITSESPSGFTMTQTAQRLKLGDYEEFTAYLFLNIVQDPANQYKSKRVVSISIEAKNKKNTVGNLGSDLELLNCETAEAQTPIDP